MKYRTTDKALKEGYPQIIKLGYCEAENLLKWSDPEAYTRGTYGWKADVYRVDPWTAIVTGYAPCGNIRPSRELVEEYDNAARDFLGHVYGAGMDGDEIREKMQKQLRLFAEAAKEEHKNRKGGKKG